MIFIDIRLINERIISFNDDKQILQAKLVNFTQVTSKKEGGVFFIITSYNEGTTSMIGSIISFYRALLFHWQGLSVSTILYRLGNKQ